MPLALRVRESLSCLLKSIVQNLPGLLVVDKFLPQESTYLLRRTASHTVYRAR